MQSARPTAAGSPFDLSTSGSSGPGDHLVRADRQVWTDNTQAAACGGLARLSRLAVPAPTGPDVKQLIAVLDAVSEWTGRAVAWLTLAMVLVTFVVVVLRYPQRQSQKAHLSSLLDAEQRFQRPHA